LIDLRVTKDRGEEKLSMGRMLDALKRAERGEVEERLTAPPSTGTSSPTEVPSEVEEEIPYIEVGPHKSIEASRSVLASAPVAPLSPPTEPLPGAPASRKVQFRALPAYRERSSHFAAELVAFHAPEQMEARQYRAVLDAIRNAFVSGLEATVLLFTASRAGIGNTTTVLNLAITAAREGRERVLVLDAHLRQPAVAERLGLPAAPGLREVLAGSVALQRAVQPTEQSNLFVLTAGLPDCGLKGNPLSEDEVRPRFVAQTMRSLFRQLRSQFQLLFVDGPPRGGRPDGMMLDSASDALYVVLPEREAESTQIDSLLQAIPNQGGCLAGCILVTESSHSS
jgi:Mrp family chromosome partitioning ATPase